MSTISTGEHFIIDLVAGLICGCFVANIGLRRYLRAAACFALTLAWSLSIRFGYTVLLDHPWLVRTAALLTVVLALREMIRLLQSQNEAQLLTTAIAN